MDDVPLATTRVEPPDEAGLRAGAAAASKQLVRSSAGRLLTVTRRLLDHEETARLLGVTTAVVRTRLHRARQALRTVLDPHFREGAV